MIKKMKHHKFKGIGILAIIAMIVTMAACDDHFQEVNTPRDQIIAEELDESLLGPQFAQSQFHGMRGSAGGGGLQTGKNLFADLFAQYFATTAENFDSDQFVEVGFWINSGWNYIYGTPGPQIIGLREFTEENDMPLLNAVVTVWSVNVFHRMADYWGPIIYSEFGSGETSVPYDSQEEAYNIFFQELDDAIEVLEQNIGENAFGSNDLIYGGNVEQWIKFTNSLRLRLAMRVVYADEQLAQTEAEKAAAHPGGLILDNDDNALVLTTDDSLNPFEIITNWGEFRMSATMESALVGYEDPRLSEYFNVPTNPDIDEYRGMRNGLPRPAKGPHLNSDYSDMDTKWLPIAQGGTNPPIEVLRASEVHLLLAEGVLRGWNMVGGSAQQHYEDGIRASLEERTDASESEITAYINSPNTPAPYEDEDHPNWNLEPFSDIPVAWDTNGDFERNLEQIATQKWLALYPDGENAWAEVRRTKYPRLYPILESENPHVAEDEEFRRVTFVESEYDDNRVATEQAVELLGGPDRNDTRFWWNQKPDLD